MPRTAVKRVASKPIKVSKRIAAKAREQKIAQVKEMEEARAKERKTLIDEMKKSAKEEKVIEKKIKKAEKVFLETVKKTNILIDRQKEAGKLLMEHAREEVPEVEGPSVLPKETPEPMLCNRCDRAYCDKKNPKATTPRFLSCGHTMCERCILELIGGGEVICPVEGEAHTVGSDGVEQFRKNYCVMSMFE